MKPLRCKTMGQERAQGTVDEGSGAQGTVDEGSGALASFTVNVRGWRRASNKL